MANEIILLHNKNNHAIESRDFVQKTILNPTPSARAMDLLTIMVSQIHKDDTEFKEYSISKMELEEILGKQLEYRLLDNISANLASLTRKEIMVKGRKEEYKPMFKRVGFDLDSPTKTLVFELGENAKPYFIDYGNEYLNYDPFHTFPLTTFYVKRFYKICKDELERIGHGKTNKEEFELEIERIKELLNLNKYKYADIKNRILLKAQKEFKEYTDISIEFKENKKARKVISLTISVIRTKAKPEKKVSNYKPYLAFKDWLHDNIPLNEDYCDEIDDNVWVFELVDDYTALIDGDANTMYLADENGVMIDSTYQEDMDIVDEAWKLVYEMREEIKKRLD